LLDASIGLRDADGKQRMNLLIETSCSDPCYITTREAREMALALIEAAAYADECELVTQ
jgi:hypothetical protein